MAFTFGNFCWQSSLANNAFKVAAFSWQSSKPSTTTALSAFASTLQCSDVVIVLVAVDVPEIDIEVVTLLLAVTEAVDVAVKENVVDAVLDIVLVWVVDGDVTSQP